MSRPMYIAVQSPIQPPQRSYAEIDRDEIVRQVLEEAAKRIEALHGNPVYRTAWKRTVLMLRAMKP